MKFRQLAAKNVLGNKHQYGAFFLSSVFSVLIFFIYAAFIFHPDVINGKFQGAQFVSLMMIACEYIILIFSFFFVLYSCSAFLKSRKKEFGLLMLFGFRKSQLRRIVLYENMLICAVSLAVGIGLGILFSKLFFMGLSAVMEVDNPIGFAIPLPALVLTVAGYLLLFLIITVLSMRKVGNAQIVELMHESKKPKTPPRAALFLVLTAVLCLGGGYGLAYTMNVRNLQFTMLPIVALVVTGTYFLFTQLSVAAFNGLKRNKSVLYRGTNLIVITQMVHKIKDNARVLFLVSVLSAVVLTASGGLQVFHNGTKEQLLEHMPQTIGFVEEGLDGRRVADPDRVREVLRDHRLELEYELRLVGVPVDIRTANGAKTVMLVSESDYNRQAERMKKDDPVQVDEGQGVLVYPYKEFTQEIVKVGNETSFAAEGKEERLLVTGYRAGMIAKPVGSSTFLMVVDDGEFREISDRVPDGKKAVAYGFEVKDWEADAALKASREIKELVPKDQKYRFDARAIDYKEIRQMSALTVFIGVFVSVLFFLASGSLLFFKLFTEFQEEQAQMTAIGRIGLTAEEMKRIVTSQIGVLFYVPVVVGAIHAAFAMKALGNVLSTNVWVHAGSVFLVYIGLQTVYFVIARRSYLRRLKQGALAS